MSKNNNNNNIHICIAPYGRNFRGAEVCRLIMSHRTHENLTGHPFWAWRGLDLQIPPASYALGQNIVTVQCAMLQIARKRDLHRTH